MENKTIDYIKKLKHNTTQIRELFLTKIPLWKQYHEQYDKTTYQFEEGNHNDWETPIVLCFTAWMGTYGSSSTHQELRLDNNIFKKHFIQYLNNNKETIMLAVADLIEKEAVKLKIQAEEELKRNSELINNL